MGLNRMIAGRQIRKRMECQAGNKVFGGGVAEGRKITSQRMMYLGTQGLDTGVEGLKS